jgi:hypothetical protein
MSHLLKKSLVLIAGLTALLGFAAASALADASYTLTGSFATTPGPGDGEVGNLQRLAVETSTGNVLLVDNGNSRVQVFKPDGSYVAQFGSGALVAPFGIAIDQSNGDVYVSGAYGVVRYTSDGASTPTYTQDAGFTIPGVSGSIAFDQTNDQLLVADSSNPWDSRVRRYATDGTAGTSFDGSASGKAFEQLKDIAVQDDGDVIVIDHARVVRFKDDDSYAVTLAGTPDDPSTLATVPGTDELLVARDGGYDRDFVTSFLPSGQLYRYTGDTRKGTTILPTSIQAVVGMAVAGDSSHQLYAATGAGILTGGDIRVASLTPFAVQAPTVVDIDAQPSEFGARLAATIDINNDGTSWSFEYGPTTTYGKRFPVNPRLITSTTAGSPIGVSTAIGGLQPETTYHFRLVATNGGGTTASADGTFTTRSPKAPGQGNEQGERAYEQVSPVDKAGNAVDRRLTVQSAPDGSSVAYGSSGAFGGAATSILSGYYLSTRSSAAGWAVHPLDPPTINPYNVLAGPTLYVSGDNRRSVSISRRALIPGAVEGGSNLYLQDLDTGVRTLIATYPSDLLVRELTVAAAYNGSPPDASDDLSVYAFSSRTPLTPDAPTGVKNVYLFSNDKLEVAGVLPDGSIDPGGSSITAPYGSPNNVSSNGDRVFFNSPESTWIATPLYVRLNGETTKLISASHRPGDDPSVPRAAEFLAASRDGNVVYFTSTEALTSDVDTSALGNLYRYNLATDELVAVNGTANPADRGFLGVGRSSRVSQDGGYVYFVSDTTVTGDAEAGPGLYVRHGATTRLISRVSSFDSVGSVSAVSANGRYYAFDSPEKLTSASNGGKSYVYVYDAVLQSLKCVNCAPLDGAPKNATVEFGSLDQTHSKYGTRQLLDDGRLYFRTGAKLADGDVNGVDDVYEWHDDRATLISSGHSPEPSYFGDATPDGRDVFFLTSERLVKQDVDDERDLYDARMGGGIAAQNVVARGPAAACREDACQGEPSKRIGLGGVGTAGAGGSSGRRVLARASSSGGLPTAAQARALADGKVVTVKVKVNRAGSVTVSGTAKIGRSTRTVVRAVGRAKAAGAVALRLRLSSVAVRELRKRTRALPVKFSVSFGQSGRTKTISMRASARRTTGRAASVPSYSKER